MKRARRKTPNRAGRWLLIFLVPGLLCITVLVQTTRERKAAQAAYRAAERTIKQLELENQRLREEIEALQHDPQLIERIAREELNMVRPDELVLSFPHNAERKRKPSSPKEKPK
ncbi:MAG: septum formation initiator family protein [Acidobacteria bacterium]|nr:MAG: septum formation initiator family protein [Acidobacteriota bacterium]